jgi:hypothetical protein
VPSAPSARRFLDDEEPRLWNSSRTASVNAVGSGVANWFSNMGTPIRRM